MKGFPLLLLDPTQQQRIEKVTSFVAEDASGSFGILPGHTRLITMLSAGLARYQMEGSDWRYIALSSATLYFVRNQLHLIGQRFLLCEDYQSIEQALQETLALEQESLASLTRSVRRVEEEMLRRLSRLDASQTEISLL